MAPNAGLPLPQDYAYNRKCQKATLLALGNDNTPLVVLTAVHDVADPALDLVGDLAGGALGAHGDVDVLATVVDL